jgi:hypothetical protein
MNKILLYFLLFFTTSVFSQCAWYNTNTACTNNAPTVVGSSISCTPPNNNGGRRNFVVNNMVAGCTYRISNCGSGFDTQLTIRNSSGTAVGYNDDNGPACAGAAASIDFVCPANGQYWIQLNRWNCSTTNQLNGTITVTLQGCAPPPTPPVNDACSNATPLPCGTSNLAGTTVNSVPETAPSGCASQYGVWYTFTGDGQTTTISSTTTFDHELTIVSGSCGSFTNIACVDNSIGTESYTFTTTNGLTYYVYVAHWSTTSTTTGNFTISRTCTPPPTPPVNDACSNATSLPCGTSNLAGTTVNSVPEISPGGCASQYGVWYTFTGDGQTTTVSSTGAGLDQEMVILTGNNCSSLTPIVCVDIALTTTGVESYSFSTVNGMVYYVYVAHWSTTSTITGNFTISRTCSNPTNADCSGATQICNDQSFSGNSSGFGTIQDLNNLNRGCLSGNENQSSWYYFIPTTNGTISMAIQTSVDYDFAIWQGTNCSNLGTPVRCSWAATNGNTGLGNGATDLSEGSFGNGWVAPLNVTAGTFYIMVIDNFTADNTQFTIDFTFSTTDLLNCNPIPLPVTLTSFTVDCDNGIPLLKWITASEQNSDYFQIERSRDGIDWFEVSKVQAMGNSNTTKNYQFYDMTSGGNFEGYYRLKQVDFDGNFEYFDPKYILCGSNKTTYDIEVFPNPVKEELFAGIRNSIFGKGLITITDFSGKVVKQEEVDLSDGYNLINVDVKDLSNGIYIIKIISNDVKFVGRFVKN